VKTTENRIGANRVLGILVALAVALAGIPARASEPTVDICLEMGPDPIVVGQARAIAAEMFRRAGIATNWYNYHSSCPVRHRKPILIRMSSQGVQKDEGGPVAYAQPFDGMHIRILYHRVQRTVDAGLVPRLLAHVLVHEIAHVVEGTDHHSDSGIMKAHWNEEDYRQMRLAPLRFTEEDLLLIRQGLTARLKQ